MSQWSDIELDTAISGWNIGLSASQIARKLPGRTRSAVLGKLHRNQSRLTRVLPGRRPATKRNRYVKKTIDFRLSTKRRVGWTDMPGEFEVTVNSRAIAEGTTCSLTELGPGQCRWMIGSPQQNLFCGLPVNEFPGSSTTQNYCVGHGQVATNGKARS